MLSLSRCRNYLCCKETESLSLPGQASKERSLSHLLPKEQPEVINQNNLVTFQSHDHR